MNDQQRHFLSLASQLPARLTVEQAAWLLNFPEHDIPSLVAAKLLKPLGNPAPSSVKFFASSEVLELSKDRAWLNRATAAIYDRWKKLNGRKQRRPAPSETLLAVVGRAS